MTDAEAATLQPGDRVFYLGHAARVAWHTRGGCCIALDAPDPDSRALRWVKAPQLERTPTQVPESRRLNFRSES